MARLYGIRVAVVIITVAVIVTAIYVYYRDRFTLLATSRHYNPKQLECLDYSPSYPSAGGPGCSPKCVASEGRKNTSYGAGFYNETHNWPKDLLQNMHLAADILKSYGSPYSLDTERRIYLHIAFDYYCCYTIEESSKIGNFLIKHTWRPHEVQFDRLVCTITAPDRVALVLMTDENSQKSLLRWALETERDLEAMTGLRKHIPRTRLHGFHMTLAHLHGGVHGGVNQSFFPVQTAVQEVNRIIPPGTWHSAPVILHRPICKKCYIAISKT